MKNLLLALSASFLLSLAACEQDAYETGTGKFSLTTADMAEVTVDANKTASRFVTDDGDEYSLSNVFKAEWMTTADSIYRAIVYYDKPETGTAAKAVTMLPVPTLIARERWRFNAQPQDPLGVESMWVAASRKYLNMALLVKTAQTGDSAKYHGIALSRDTVYSDAGRRVAVYRLLHSQGDIPLYYTVRQYVSILLPADGTDSVSLSVNTFDGTVVRGFLL